MTKKNEFLKTKSKTERRVRVTVELPMSFIRLLGCKARLSDWNQAAIGEKARELDSGDVLAWLIYLEARGIRESEIHALTPLMWRNGGPELIHEERKVIDD